MHDTCQIQRDTFEDTYLEPYLRGRLDTPKPPRYVSRMYPACIPHVSRIYPACIPHVSFMYLTCVPPCRCAYLATATGERKGDEEGEDRVRLDDLGALRRGKGRSLCTAPCEISQDVGSAPVLPLSHYLTRPVSRRLAISESFVERPVYWYFNARPFTLVLRDHPTYVLPTQYTCIAAVPPTVYRVTRPNSPRT